MDLKRQRLDILHKLHPEAGAQWAPGHWLAHELKRPYIPNFAANLRELTAQGYLLRDQPYNKKSKHSAYALRSASRCG